MAAKAAIHGSVQGKFRYYGAGMARRYREPKEPCVYILCSKRDGILYTGVTSAIHDRMMRHRTGADEGFTKRYGVHHLVYYEFHESMVAAIERESRIKKWKRAWKVRIIQEMNPEWLDLFDQEEGIRLAPADVERMRDG